MHSFSLSRRQDGIQPTPTCKFHPLSVNPNMQLLSLPANPNIGVLSSNTQPKPARTIHYKASPNMHVPPIVRWAPCSWFNLDDRPTVCTVAGGACHQCTASHHYQAFHSHVTALLQQRHLMTCACMYSNTLSDCIPGHTARRLHPGPVLATSHA